MNEFFQGIVSSIKEHTLLWAGGAVVTVAGAALYARSHPMQPMQAMQLQGAGKLPPKPKNKGKDNGGLSYPPQPPPVRTGGGHPLYIDGSHDQYGYAEGGVILHGPWLPATEDLRSN